MQDGQGNCYFMIWPLKQFLGWSEVTAAHWAFMGWFFFTRHVVYSKIIPKSPGLTTSKRKTGFVLTSPWKFLIILINSVLQEEEDCDLYIATCDHHFNVLLVSLKVIFIVQYNYRKSIFCSPFSYITFFILLLGNFAGKEGHRVHWITCNLQLVITIRPG